MVAATQRKRTWKLAACLAIFFAVSLAEPLPMQLHGAWRITRLLPTTNTTCWTADQAKPLIGTTLDYGPNKITWKGGDVPLLGISTRTIDSSDLASEYGHEGRPVDFAELGINKSAVLEVNLQHEDADITGASTEVPGDSVLLAAPNRIVASACGVFFEAIRVVASKPKPQR